MKSKMIYLIRHGKIERENEQRCYIGQIDPPLSEEGRNQAKQLSARLSRIKIDAVYSSDLSRSLETATQIAVVHGVVPQIRPDLREIAMGDWEGLSFAEVARKYPKEFKQRGADIGYFRPPHGESFAECSNRAIPAFNDIIDSSFENIVIVGHAGVNRLIICNVLGMALANLFRISQDYACLNGIMIGDFGYRLKLLNSNVRN